MIRQIKRDELANEFQRIISGANARISQSPLGGYMPYEHEMLDNSYFISDEELRKCLGITQEQENE